MDIVKKNIVSIVCGVVALICVILVFFPLGGWYSQKQADVKARKEVGDKLLAVRNEQRHWPTLSPKEEDRTPLKRFPTEQVTQVGENITKAWTKQTNDFVEAVTAIQSGALKQLVPNLLPGVAGNQTLPFRFMEAYRQLMPLTGPAGASGAAGMGIGMGRPNDTSGAVVEEGPPKPVLGTPLVGRMPPTDAEIKVRGDVIAANIRRDMPVVINGAVSNQKDVDDAVVVALAQLGDQIRNDVAINSIVYVDPQLSFVASDKIVGSVAPSYDDIFIAQTGLWLQQELCRAVYDVNKPVIDKANPKQGVVDAPIKRLIGIRFTLPYTPPVTTPGGAPAVAAAPTDVPVLPGLPAAKVAVDFTRNPLGQVSNDLYDVLPFRMSLICEAETLPQTLAGLTKGRFITIRNMDVTAVDAALAYTQGFIYGNKPLVQVDLRGQYLMMRKFIGPLMPPNIIRGLATPATGTPGAPDPNGV